MSIEISTPESSITAVTLSEAELMELGLNPADTEEISRVASSIQPTRRASVTEFGREIADHTGSYADSLLDQVRNKDLNDAGKMLTEVVSLARSLDSQGLSAKRSQIPVIGPLIDKVRRRAGDLSVHFDTTKGQIDKLMESVGEKQTNIQSRNEQLEQMFGSVGAEHRLLGIHVAAARIRLGEMRQEVEAIRHSAGSDPTLVQAIADMDASIAQLDKRAGDLRALQHSALQSMPMIRMLQSNNTMLVSKFHSIREVTVPSWKRQFMLRLALTEQRSAVELANEIDDATNAIMKSNAQLLHINSVDSAKANQRLVIDVETLQQVQASLINTVQEVIRINHEGAKSRVAAEKQVMSMRADLQQRLANISAAKQLEQGATA